MTNNLTVVLVRIIWFNISISSCLSYIIKGSTLGVSTSIIVLTFLTILCYWGKNLPYITCTSYVDYRICFWNNWGIIWPQEFLSYCTITELYIWYIMEPKVTFDISNIASLLGKIFVSKLCGYWTVLVSVLPPYN